jgi:uncharacterized protein (TIGR02118 family)
MVKLVFIAYRKQGMTPEEFRRYWFEDHAACVRSVKDTIRMRRYIQSHPLSREVNAEFAAARGIDLDELPDGIAEAWWDSAEDMNAGFSGDEGSKASQKLIEDEARFLDFDRCRAFLTEERTIIELDEEPAGAASA